jgi:hypothetical protein
MKASEIDSILTNRPVRDEQNTARLSNTRRPRLTLRHLHRLRLMRELKKLEAAKERKFVSDMYGSAYEESDDKTKDSKSPPKELKPPKPLKPSKYLDKYTR